MQRGVRKLLDTKFSDFLGELKESGIIKRLINENWNGEDNLTIFQEQITTKLGYKEQEDSVKPGRKIYKKKDQTLKITFSFDHFPNSDIERCILILELPGRQVLSFLCSREAEINKGDSVVVFSKDPGRTVRTPEAEEGMTIRDLIEYGRGND